MKRRSVMIAAIPEAAREIVAAIAPLGLDLVAAHGPDEALTLFRESAPNLVVVGYLFDELHPYRLIESLSDVRRRRNRSFSIIMASTLPLHFTRLNQRDVDATYRLLGANHVFFAERRPTAGKASRARSALPARDGRLTSSSAAGAAP